MKPTAKHTAIVAPGRVNLGCQSTSLFTAACTTSINTGLQSHPHPLAHR